MVQDKKFCGGSLRTVTIIIGFGFILYGLLSAFWTAVVLDQINLGSLAINITEDTDGNINVAVDKWEGVYYNTNEVELVCRFFFCFLEILAAFSLIFGAVKYERVFLIPILILLPVDLLFMSIGLPVWFSWVNLIIKAIATGVYTFAWIIIFSFWRQLKIG